MAQLKLLQLLNLPDEFYSNIYYIKYVKILSHFQ